MPSPNIIAAASSAAKQRAKKAKDTSGFDAVDAVLCDRLHSIIPSKTKTAQALLNTSHKHLKSSFSDSIGVARPKSDVSTSLPPVTPSNRVSSTHRATRSTAIPATAAHRTRLFEPSPVKFPSYDDRVVYMDDDDDDITDIPRHDLRLVQVSSSLYGVRRLRINEIIRLRCHEEFILFIPPTSKNDPPEVKSSREGLLRQMRRIVMAPYMTSSTPQQRELLWNKHLEKRQVQREGNDGYEFNVRVHSYPERFTMDRPSIPPGELKYLLNPVTKSGFFLELMGSGTAVTCHLPMLSIPFVEAYVLRKPDAPYLDDIAFTKSKDETKQVAFMAKELLVVLGVGQVIGTDPTVSSRSGCHNTYAR